MTKQEKRIYEFGPFRIDNAERMLRRGTDVIPLSPLVTDTLLALLESGGRALTKDELLDRIWPDTTIEPGGLNQNICALRRVLGDSRHNTEYIKTIAKLGFRFLKPVKVIQEETFPARSLAVLPLENISKDPAEYFFAEGMT